MPHQHTERYQECLPHKAEDHAAAACYPHAPGHQQTLDAPARKKVQVPCLLVDASESSPKRFLLHPCH